LQFIHFPGAPWAPLAPLVALCLLLPSLALADEGMWLFNLFPKDQVAKQYGFQVTDDFLRHMQLAAVRFNSGGTGSFVSPDGLLFTNHHVAADCIQKLSDSKNDYLKNGFYARTPAEEKACPDLEVNVLKSIENVTTRVNQGISPDTPAADANQKKKAAMSLIEKECTASSGNRCDVVTLFSGGQYHLYQYKKYTDIRLVFAPDFGIAFFGGDPDNFTYPRYNLDVTFFRAYENGQAVRPERWFRWSKDGARDGELVFVPGNPGTTGRMMTVSQLEFARDHSYALTLRQLGGLIAALQSYMATGAEQARIGGDNLFGAQNSFKAFTGFMRGLQDEKLMSEKRDSEKKLRAGLAARDARRGDDFSRFLDELGTAYGKYRSFYRDYMLLETGAGRGSELFDIARHVLRYSEETRKPNDRRLREYAESGLPSLEQRLYSAAPIHASMEIAVLTEYLRFLQSELGATHPTVTAVLQGKSPAAAARAFVESSKLQDIALRKQLAADPAAARQSQDGMLRLALALDAPARQARQRFEDEVESIVLRAASQVALARYELSGGNEYPDATFTLRVAYGQVRGYKNDAGAAVPWATDFAGLYRKATGKEPYILPDHWKRAQSALRLDTPFNFVGTADTHGGNSGSATLNTKGEVVGILFDGNLEGLPSRFVYLEQQGRSVHVASQGIIEALRKVYKADRVLKELGY
jgi:hypothetical protein